MGVSGCGKTTIGRLLSKTKGWPFLDGDDYHPRENVEKMANGIPLTDADREPWLLKLRDSILEHQNRSEPVIVACSALKASYRGLLSEGLEDIQWIHLTGDRRTLESRLNGRQDHFMPPSLLQSQLDVLEDPVDAIMIDISMTPEEIVEAIEVAI
jgi:gluconokinase